MFYYLQDKIIVAKHFWKKRILVLVKEEANYTNRFVLYLYRVW